MSIAHDPDPPYSGNAFVYCELCEKPTSGPVTFLRDTDDTDVMVCESCAEDMKPRDLTARERLQRISSLDMLLVFVISSVLMAFTVVPLLQILGMFGVAFSGGILIAKVLEAAYRT